MKFRPCVDLHEGKVKQIVGSSLDSRESTLETNFTSEKPSSYFASLYARRSMRGGHVVMLGKGNRDAALEALRAFPGGLQVGGGITPRNCREYLEAGASHVIVTSYVFTKGEIDFVKIREMVDAVGGKKRLVLDLSCRKKDKNTNDYYVVTDRWQTFTNFKLSKASLEELSRYCDEFLVHGVDVEGMRCGVLEDLVVKLGEWSPIPVTYAGGARSVRDLDRVEVLGKGRVDLTIGSALDVFGGELPWSQVVEWDAQRRIEWTNPVSDDEKEFALLIWPKAQLNARRRGRPICATLVVEREMEFVNDKDFKLGDVQALAGYALHDGGGIDATFLFERLNSAKKRVGALVFMDPVEDFERMRKKAFEAFPNVKNVTQATEDEFSAEKKKREFADEFVYQDVSTFVCENHPDEDLSVGVETPSLCQAAKDPFAFFEAADLVLMSEPWKKPRELVEWAGWYATSPETHRGINVFSPYLDALVDLKIQLPESPDASWCFGCDDDDDARIPKRLKKERMVDVRTGKEVCFHDATCTRRGWTAALKKRLVSLDAYLIRRAKGGGASWGETELAVVYVDRDDFVPVRDSIDAEEKGWKLSDPAKSFPLPMALRDGHVGRPTDYELLVLETSCRIFCQDDVDMKGIKVTKLI